MKIFSNHVSSQAVILFVFDLVASIVAVFAARSIVYGLEGAWDATLGGGYAASTATYAVLVAVALGSMGLYDPRQRYGLEGALVRALVGICIAGTVMAVIGFLFNLDENRWVWLLAFALTVVLLGMVRIGFDRLVDDDIFRRRILVYGAGQRAQSILQLRRQSDQRGFRVVGFWPAAGDKNVMDDPRVMKAAESDFLELVRSENIDEIVVAMDDRRRNFPVSDLLECKLSGIRVIDILEFLERESGRVKVDLMSPSWLIFSESLNRRSRRHISFRVLDLAIAIGVFIVAWPFMIIIAIVIWVADGRPILYRQTRAGLNGQPFTLFKFRSMGTDAEAGGSPVWATVDDPRVTRVGYWLRKLRLDELPQLFNVLSGDMSIVGPRPERPEFVARLAEQIPYYQVRHYVKPGITGWAQLCYPYGASEKDALAKLEFDMYYMKNRSVVFYLMILLQTAEVVLWQKGSR